mgnify:CR=1 FL=1
MLKRRVTKIIFVLFCLITLVMPHISTVLAEVTRTRMSSPVNLFVIMPREGGEVSGEITDSTELQKYNQYYDKTQYVYKIAGNAEHPDGVTVFKIVSDDNGANYQNEIYCLNATYQFPGQSTIGTRDVEYSEIANFANETDCLMGEFDEKHLEVLELIFNKFSGAVACSDGIEIGVMSEEEITSFTKEFLCEYAKMPADECRKDVEGWVSSWPGIDDKTIAYMIEEVET